MEKNGIFNATSSFDKFWDNYQSIIKMNQDLMVFILETTCLKIKDGAYVINLDECAGVGTHWVALLCKRNEIVYFDSFSVEYTSEEIEKFIGNKNKI